MRRQNAEEEVRKVLEPYKPVQDEIERDGKLESGIDNDVSMVDVNDLPRQTDEQRRWRLEFPAI